MKYPSRSLTCLIVAIASLTVGCGNSEDSQIPAGTAPSAPAAVPEFKTLDEASTTLATCPEGDLSWRNGVRLGNSDQDLRAPLILLGRRLEQECEGSWQPIWLQAELAPPEQQGERLEACLERARGRDQVGVARCANELAWLHYQAAELDSSEELYQEAIEAAVSSERSDLASYARGNYSGLLVERGRFAAASDLMERTESDLRAAGQAQNALWAAYNQAVLSVELGDAIRSEVLLDRVQQESSASGDQWIADASLVVRGNLHLALGELDLATKSFSAVSPADVSLRLRAELGLARRLIRSGQPDQAAQQLRRTLALPELDAVGSTLVEAYLGDALHRSGSAEWETMLRRALKSGDVQDAVSPRWTSRWLLGRALSRERRYDEAEKLLRESTDILDAAQSELDPSTLGLRFLKERSEPYVELAALFAVRGPSHHVELLDAMQRIHARALREDARAPVSLNELQRGLPQQSLMLASVLGRDVGVLFAIGRGQAQAVVLPGRQILAPWVAEVRQSLGQGAALPREAAQGLTQALLAPLASLIEGANQLWILPDGELALLPWGALEWNDAPLLASVDLALLPWIGPPPQAQAKLSPVLLAGRPEFAADDAWQPLPWAGFEISEIQQIWPDSTLLVGEAFRHDSLVAATQRQSFATVHLATHAIASTRDPRKCGLILSGGERMDLDKIGALPLENSLVVLSACRTGEGELLPGEGVVGLRWALLKAGARAIVVTQWTVDDRATARLMADMHRHLREGQSVVRALSLARRASLEAADSSLAWAPYQVVLRPAETQRVSLPVDFTN